MAGGETSAPPTHVVFETTVGDFTVELYYEQAPKTCWNIAELARRGYYNNTIFHRIIKDFMIQGGDPTGTGRGGESVYGAKFEDEITKELKHTGAGVLSMANSGPNTNGSQFFITLAPTPWLDGKHTVFGRISQGMKVIQRMGLVPTGANDRIASPPPIMDTLAYAELKATPHATEQPPTATPTNPETSDATESANQQGALSTTNGKIETDDVQLLSSTPEQQPLTTTTTTADAQAAKTRKQAWANVLPLAPAFPNIFDFVPLPELHQETTKPEPRPATTDIAPGVSDEPPPLPAPTTSPSLASLLPAATTPTDLYRLRVTETLQTEKNYPLPTDWPSFGWLEIAQLGLCLSYKVMLLRRQLSPRFLILDETDSTSLDAMAFRPVTTAACCVLASAGLVFNTTTEELLIRQQGQQPQAPHNKNKNKKKKSSSRSPTKKRKYLVVRPILPRKHQQHNTTATPLSAAIAMDRLHSNSSARLLLGDGGAIEIFRALRVNTSLRSLTLDRVGLSDLAMGALAAMVRTNTTLTELHVPNNSITHVGLSLLSEALEQNADSTLFQLNLSKNLISDFGIPSISKALQENETLVFLDLSWNQISSKGVLFLLENLRDNFVLRGLSIYGKDLDEDQFCENIASKYAFEIATLIRKVNISFSQISISGKKAVLPIDKMKNSRWLLLPAKELVELDVLVISGLIPLNGNLISLDLSHNPKIERWAILEILKSIKHCKTLKHVNLNETGLYEEVGEQIGDLVVSNSTLETILMHEEPLFVQQLRGQESMEKMSFTIPENHHFDRWILAKCLALNRPTQELNTLRIPPAIQVGLGGESGANATWKNVNVNVSLRKMDFYEIVFLAKKVFYHLHIARIAMNGCGITSYGGIAIADALRNHASLECLEMENNCIGVRGGQAIAEAVFCNKSLQTLNLSWNQIGNDGILGFEKALHASKTLLKLDLRGNELSASGISALARGLQKNASLHELYLRWNTICSVGAKALASALTQNKTLKVLDIDHHTMGPQGAVAFAEMLAVNTTLQELHMNGDDAISDGHATGIGSDAAVALAQVLKSQNSTLTHLSLAQNQIGSEGILAFSDVVKFTKKLRVLDLSIGEMDGKIAERFFMCLSMNQTLEKLLLAHNRIGNEGMMACLRMLETNVVLQELNVAHNNITEEPLALLALKWQKRTSAVGGLSVTKTSVTTAAGGSSGPGPKPATTGLRWLCLTGNSMTESTKRALRALPPSLTIELDEERHQVPGNRGI